jgi:hypothetical protein
LESRYTNSESTPEFCTRPKKTIENILLLFRKVAPRATDCTSKKIGDPFDCGFQVRGELRVPADPGLVCGEQLRQRADFGAAHDFRFSVKYSIKKKRAKSENSLCFLLGHVFVVAQLQSSIIGSQLALTVGNHQKRVVSRTKAKVSVFVRNFEKLVQTDVNLRNLYESSNFIECFCIV